MLSGVFHFRFRPKMNVRFHFRFRFVVGRKWSFIFVSIFVYDRKWKMLFGRPVVYITKRSWSWSWSWHAKSWSWTLGFVLVLVLVLKLRSCSWSWKKFWLHHWYNTMCVDVCTADVQGCSLGLETYPTSRLVSSRRNFPMSRSRLGLGLEGLVSIHAWLWTSNY